MSMKKTRWRIPWRIPLRALGLLFTAILFWAFLRHRARVAQCDPDLECSERPAPESP
jgi:hypothetical protein